MYKFGAQKSGLGQYIDDGQSHGSRRMCNVRKGQGDIVGNNNV